MSRFLICLVYNKNFIRKIGQFAAIFSLVTAYSLSSCDHHQGSLMLFNYKFVNDTSSPINMKFFLHDHVFDFLVPEHDQFVLPELLEEHVGTLAHFDSLSIAIPDQQPVMFRARDVNHGDWKISPLNSKNYENEYSEKGKFRVFDFRRIFR